MCGSSSLTNGLLKKTKTFMLLTENRIHLVYCTVCLGEVNICKVSRNFELRGITGISISPLRMSKYILLYCRREERGSEEGG